MVNHSQSGQPWSTMPTIVNVTMVKTMVHMTKLNMVNLDENKLLIHHQSWSTIVMVMISHGQPWLI